MSMQQFWWKKKTAARHIQFTMADSEKIRTSVRMMKRKVTKNNKMYEKKIQYGAEPDVATGR